MAAFPYHTLVLIRHGESTWDKENRFTGWTDEPLSDRGRQEAIVAAEVLKEKGYKFDIAYTSLLSRDITTCWTILDQIDQCSVPVKTSWRLNERHYGALQGLNNSEAAEKYGEEEVNIWKRAYDVCPPDLDSDDQRYQSSQPFIGSLTYDCLPTTESLATCIDRVLPLWQDTIAPQIDKGKTVLIVAHGDCLRGLIKHFDKMTEEAILELNIPTGVPLVYELNFYFKSTDHYYLMDEAEFKAKVEALVNQG